MTLTLCLSFTSAFISATLFPGGSELLFLQQLYQHPSWGIWLFVTVLVGNTLGAMTSYLLGRFIAKKPTHALPPLLEKYGIWALLLSWLPIIGDALPLAAGWLNYSWLLSLLLIAIGKAMRYGFLWIGMVWVI